MYLPVIKDGCFVLDDYGNTLKGEEFKQDYWYMDSVNTEYFFARSIFDSDETYVKECNRTNSWDVGRDLENVLRKLAFENNAEVVIKNTFKYLDLLPKYSRFERYLLLLVPLDVGIAFCQEGVVPGKTAIDYCVDLSTLNIGINK